MKSKLKGMPIVFHLLMQLFSLQKHVSVGNNIEYYSLTVLFFMEIQHQLTKCTNRYIFLWQNIWDWTLNAYVLYSGSRSDGLKIISDGLRLIFENFIFEFVAFPMFGKLKSQYFSQFWIKSHEIKVERDAYCISLANAIVFYAKSCICS